MSQRLETVSYFRLSGYSHPFRKRGPADSKLLLDEFKPGTTFDEVWARYAFDRHFRLLVMDAIERIEVALRSHLATLHAQRHGLFSYAIDKASLPSLTWQEWTNFLGKIRMEQDRSKEAFVKHFKSKYGDAEPVLPIWTAAEVWSFGTLMTFHRGCHQDIRREVAMRFGVHETVFASWLLTLNTVRNICAHHGRLWNREIGTKPKIPDKIPEWHDPVEVSGDRMFAVLTICKWSLDRIAPQSRWDDRLRALLAASPDIPLVSMGFPEGWEASVIWSREGRRP